MLRMAPFLLWEPHSTCWLIPTCTGRCFLDYAWNVFDFFNHPACSLFTNMVTCLATNSVSFLRCVQVAYSLPPLLLKHFLTTHPPTLLHADHLKSAWLLFLYVYASLVSVLLYMSGRLMSRLPCLLPLFRFPLTLSVFLSSPPLLSSPHLPLLCEATNAQNLSESYVWRLSYDGFCPVEVSRFNCILKRQCWHKQRTLSPQAQLPAAIRLVSYIRLCAYSRSSDTLLQCWNPLTPFVVKYLIGLISGESLRVVPCLYILIKEGGVSYNSLRTVLFIDPVCKYIHFFGLFYFSCFLLFTLRVCIQ